MNESVKNVILIAAAILTVSSCLMAISSSQTSRKIQQSLDQERYIRMTAEEKLNDLTGQNNALKAELDVANGKIQSIQAVMEQGKSVNSDLQAQLDSISQIKQSLEKKLTEIQKMTDEAAQAVNQAQDQVQIPEVINGQP